MRLRLGLTIAPGGFRDAPVPHRVYPIRCTITLAFEFHTCGPRWARRRIGRKARPSVRTPPNPTHASQGITGGRVKHSHARITDQNSELDREASTKSNHTHLSACVPPLLLDVAVGFCHDEFRSHAPEDATDQGNSNDSLVQSFGDVAFENFLGGSNEWR